MRHPRTGKRLDWIRVVDYYHASERIWAMADALFGKGPVSKSWARLMLKLLLKPRVGVGRRVPCAREVVEDKRKRIPKSVQLSA
jgi:hypothetical protein